MRFLRILPAVWAIISCPFSSLTRKVALGSNSETVPGNSSNSSLAIRVLCRKGRAAGACTWEAENQALSLQIKRRYQREDAPRRVEIHLDLAVEAVAQEVRAVVVQPAPSHVDGLDPCRRRLANGGVIGLAELMVVLQHAAKRREREEYAPVFALIMQPHIQDQTVIRGGENEMIGPARRTFRLEMILFQDVVDGDVFFLLDLGRMAP